MRVLNLSLSLMCSSCLACAWARAEGWLRRASRRACRCSLAYTPFTMVSHTACHKARLRAAGFGLAKVPVAAHGAVCRLMF